MEINIIQLLGVMLGSNSIVGIVVAIITVKYQKKKAQDEAQGRAIIASGWTEKKGGK